MATDPTNLNDPSETDGFIDKADLLLGAYPNIEHTIINGTDYVVVAAQNGFEVHEIDPVTKTFVDPVTYRHSSGTVSNNNSQGGSGSDDLQQVDMVDSDGVTHSFFMQYGRDNSTGVPTMTVHDYNHATNTWTSQTQDGSTLGIDNSNNSVMFQAAESENGEVYGYIREGISSGTTNPGALQKVVLNPDTGLWEAATDDLGQELDFDTTYTGGTTNAGNFNFEILTDPTTGKQYVLSAYDNGFTVYSLDADGNVVANSAINYNYITIANQTTGSLFGFGTTTSIDTAFGNGSITMDANGNIVMVSSDAGAGGLIVIDPEATDPTSGVVQGMTRATLGKVDTNPEIIFTPDGEMVVSSTDPDVGTTEVNTSVLQWNTATGQYDVISKGQDTTFGYEGSSGYGSWDTDFTTLSNGDTVYLQAAGAGDGSNPAFNWLTINDTTVVGEPLTVINAQVVNPQICFSAGTQILTDQGEMAVENLKIGDLVKTKDNGFKPIRWIGKNTISIPDNKDKIKLSPIRIAAHALGGGLPANDLYVSPQHRVLVKSKIARRICGDEEVLVAANQLLEFDGISSVEDCDEVTYVHFLFDQHEIVYSNGAETESLYTGPEALQTIGGEALKEVLSLFPQLTRVDYKPVPSRTIVSGRDSRELLKRHLKNEKPLYAM